MKRAISLLCTLALAFGLLCPAVTARAAGGEKERVIDVVYDDSGSMCNGVDRWSQALYAMEIFCTMLGSEDEMNVFLMSDSGDSPVHVEGDEPDRVEKIISSFTSTGNTPIATVEAAASHISGADAEKERWLVVLTDGAFQDHAGHTISSVSTLQQQIEGYAQPGINVVYLAIGAKAMALTGNNANFFTYSAADSDQILGCITAIANQIFQQQILPASHIAANGGVMTLDIDIPVSQLLVFAQGEDISVSGMTLDGASLSPTETHRVEVTGADTPEGMYKPMALLADGLCGVVQTYTASGAPYAKGTYELTVSDSSNVQIYYIAGTDIDCHLTYNGVEVKDDEKHYAGEYGISMRFLDPLTGEEVRSDLLDGAVFTAELKNGEDVQTIDDTVDTVFLREGEIELNASAELPGHVTVSSSHSYTVYPEPILLELSAQLPGNGYKLAALGEGADPILITVTEQETGEKLSREAWEAMGDGGLRVQCGQNVNWLVQRGSEVSTWEIRPDYITDMSDTDSGAIELTLKAEYELGNQYASGASTLTVDIAGYVASELRVEITPPDQAIPLNDLANAQGGTVTLYTKDEYTGEYTRLTREQSERAELTVEAKSLNWKLTPGSEPGTWNLLPENDAARLTFSGESTVVVVTGVLEDGALIYQGSDSAELPLTPLTVLDKIGIVLPFAVGFGVVLFVALGYLCKKKLRYRQLKPYVQNPETLERLNVAKKRIWWSYLLPWARQRAKITCFVPAYHCTFANAAIRAAGGGGFHITNIESYNSDSVRLNGKRVDPAKDRKRIFTHVTLTALDEGEEAVGKCHF